MTYLLNRLRLSGACGLCLLALCALTACTDGGADGGPQSFNAHLNGSYTYAAVSASVH